MADPIPMTSYAANEIDLANIFAARHARELRYVDLWGRWMFWNGKKWEQESTLLAFDLARAVAREAARACRENNEKNCKWHREREDGRCDRTACEGG